LTTLTTTREIPLYFVAAESGDFEISFDYIESFENDTVILIDLLTGAEVDLKINPTYSFSADPTDSEYRFKLVFNPDAVSIKESPSQDENRPIVSSVHEKIIIDWNTENDIHATVRVLDLSGRKLGEYSTNETSTFSIAAGAWTQQIVLVQIMNKHSVYNYKLFIQ
jgi:hypothetical protein